MITQETREWLDDRVRRYRRSRYSGRHWLAMQELANNPPAGGGNEPPQSLLDEIAKTRELHTRKVIYEALQRSDLKRLQFVAYGDGTLTSLPLETWEKVLDWSDIDRVRYVVDQRTCSNFAQGLAGQVALRCGVDGCGVVVDFSGGHAYCALLVHDKRGRVYILIVEPQTDGRPKVGTKLSGNEAYRAERGYVLFA